MTDIEAIAKGRYLSAGLTAWAWLTPAGNLAPVPTRDWAKRHEGRGPVALVKITLKKRIKLESKS